MVVVTMPKLGLIMTEGTVISWYKKEGDHVEEGELLCQIETQKISNDIVSPATGTVVHIFVREGETVECQEPVAEIEEQQ